MAHTSACLNVAVSIEEPTAEIGDRSDSDSRHSLL